MVDSKNTFNLKVDDSNFRERQKNVFDQLNALESIRNKNAAPQPMETDEKPIDKKSYRSATRQFRGKESIFKKPQNPVPKGYNNRMPDFKKNPHKWTRYSLEDVREEDCSERSNTKAALSFLDDLKKRRSAAEQSDESEKDSPNKIVFKRHHKINKKPVQVEEEEKPTFRSSKVVMPEYVVGQKVKKEKKNRAIKKGSVKELKLDHLIDEEEDTT
ncbi:unnamed protein product [Brassicogethes aeneus]|uniref:U5 small nuclear ribonucleoprotein TSSC4 n=1 Tax=Brassicogethes aeneus TaxID=1431903 RepID=A0A9P0AV79_BRAAE|nr:unnamed protein product [Brassicogethes aeneus]